MGELGTIINKKYSRVSARINLDNLISNVDNINKCIKGDAKIIAVIKTDAYGHGAKEIANELENKDCILGYAVATADEGAELRINGIKKKIFLLGASFPSEYEEVLNNNLIPAVFSLETAQKYNDIAKSLGIIADIQIVIDTGMNRIGLKTNEESADLIRDISQLSNINICGMFTHFAKADETDKSFSDSQFNKYLKMINMLNDRGINIPLKHASNSAAIIDLPDTHLDAVRAGIILYGLIPSYEVNYKSIVLKPVLSLKSHIIYIKTIDKGEAISYGGTFIADSKMKIATIPVGYGDGYPRSLSNKGYVLIKGKKAPICGRICMDQFMVDVTDIDDVSLYDEVTLIGEDNNNQITVEELSDICGRFNYEFVCDLSKRIPRIFYKEDQIISKRDYYQ